MKKSSASHLTAEKCFLWLGITFGFLWCFLIPPFQTPDDFHHFFRAYMVSEGHWVAINDSMRTDLGDYLPESLAKVASESGATQIPFHAEIKQDLQQLLQASKIKLNPEKIEFMGFYNTSLYSPIPYAPQALGIWLGREMDFPVLYIFFLARIFNLFVFLSLGYLAVSTIPFFKLQMVCVALLPMSLHLAASMNADSMTIGSSLYFTSLVLYWAASQEKTKIRTSQLVLLYSLSLLVAMSKTVYLPLCLLFLLIPKSKFASPLHCRFAQGLFLLVPVSVAVGWSQALRGLYVPLPVAPMAQLSIILQNPVDFLTRLANSAFIKPDLNSAFQLGWLDTALPSIVSIIYILLILFPWVARERPFFQCSEKAKGFFILALFLGIYVGIYLAIFLSWPQPISDQIVGVQGRYIIPIFILFPLAIKLLIQGGKRINTVVGDYTKYYAILIASALMITSHSLYVRYYAL